MQRQVSLYFKLYARDDTAFDGSRLRLAHHGAVFGGVHQRQGAGIPVERLEPRAAAERDVAARIEPVLVEVIDGQGGAEVHEGAAHAAEQVSRREDGGRPVIGQIDRKSVAQKQFLMFLVQQEQMAALAGEGLAFLLGQDVDGGNDEHGGLLPVREREGEVHPLLALVPVGLSEGHPVGPGRFQGGVSYFYEQIGHRLQI